MQTVALKPDIYWVGAIDWAVRDFHGYITPRGSTYNNFLILDDEPTLIDGVKGNFSDISLDNIRRLVDPGKIKHFVVNHIEPDHSGGIADIMAHLSPDVQIYCTQKGKLGLYNQFDESQNWNINVVKTGHELKIGKRTLMFLESPMLHWPDSMMTYAKEDKVLFSQDAFGQHIASSERFDDEFIRCSSGAELEDAIWDYYANILMPFGQLVKRKIEEVTKLRLELDIIAPDHGIIWRGDPGYVVNKYLDMATGKADERVTIVYDTMWHSTEKMVGPIMEGIKAEGVDIKVVKLRSTPTSVAIKEFWRSRSCLIGSPTLNNTLFPQVAEFLYSLKGLRPKNRMLGAFGSYGWAGGAIKEVLEVAKGLKLEVVEPGLGVKSVPTVLDMQNCFDFGRDFAIKTKEYHKNFV